MPRTTIDLDATVLADLKRRQRRENKSLGRIASELLAKSLAADAGEHEDEPFEWRSAPMRARVDIADKDALYRALDES
jgi:hypothetical protein